MADVPIDCDFPIWGLLPKKETGVVSFLNKNPEYDGRDTVIAIFDSGVDPAAAGLKVTSTGETKVVERFDCSGCGDVDTSTVITTVADGTITGLTGRKLAIPQSWKNPKGEWRVGILHPFSLYPGKLKERIQDYRKEKRWDMGQKPAFAKANKDLQDFESQNASNSTLSVEDKLMKEELEARVDVLTSLDKKYNDIGPTYDCVLFHDGSVWRACIDTSECGDLSTGTFLGEYSMTHEHAHLTPVDEMTVSINVHNDGNTLEVVGMCSTHGTHVAAIAAGYFPDEPDKNGVAPGAKIVSLTIGDSRLGSMETGTALIRACIKVMELAKTTRVDVINMSYGEHAHWSNSGRLGEVMAKVVNEFGVAWVVSAGNHGPALCTVGAPPDINKAVHIGVGAYVSPEMMVAAYSMRGGPQAGAGAGAFTWSSRGPAADGGAQPSVCAPGGAVAPVARFTLRNSQLMNGTSMAAPHVAGAIAALLSGLKAKHLPYSPYSVKRALENSANYLSHVEPWAQGAGLLNIERAFDILSTYHDAVERDVTFNLQCGTNNGRGILLRPQQDDPPKDVGVSVEPQFLHSHEDTDKRVVIQQQISFHQRLTLTCAAPWVSAPQFLDMMNACRPLSVRIDTRSLPPGPHFASINAFDVTCVEKGPVFRIPITVFQPEPLDLACAGPPTLSANQVLFRPSTIKRHFISVPADATWALLKMITPDKGKSGRFLVHTMQMLPKRSCRSHETQKMVNVTSETPMVLPFQLVGGVTLEVVLAKYWANAGDLPVNYLVEFHGIRPDFGRQLTFHASQGIHPLNLLTLRTEELQPSAQLKFIEPVLRPSESKLSPLSSRDVIPPSRQIYQLINTYTFHIAKTTDVCPQVPILCDVLYESEFESQMWMLFNSCKQLLAVGDAYPSKYSVKLDKGEYTLRLGVRHEQKSLLERLSEACLVLQQKLPQSISLDIYGDHGQAIVGGKKLTSTTLTKGTMLPIYLAAVPHDKISRSSLSVGVTLSGSIHFAREELGRRCDSLELRYVPAEAPRKPPARNEKRPDEYADAERDLHVTWLPKLEGEKLEQVYEELVEKYPSHAGVHVAYLNAVDPPSDASKLPHADTQSDATTAWCDQLISIADKVIKSIDQDKLLAFLGMKNDTRPDANKIKQEQEKQRGFLVEALCRKGTALCRLQSRANDRLTALADNHATLATFADITDSKVIHYGVWHSFTLKHWGRAIKLLNKIQEERPSRDIDERLIEAYKQLQWNHLADYTEKTLPSKYPASYRPF